MSDERQPPRITIDDLAESAASGVLRALSAREVSATDFTTRNGFFINVVLTAGGPGIGGVLGGNLPGNRQPDQARELPQ
jgi:hypothetical protein